MCHVSLYSCASLPLARTCVPPSPALFVSHPLPPSPALSLSLCLCVCVCERRLELSQVRGGKGKITACLGRVQQSHSRLACLPCACAGVCVGAGGDASCVCLQEDGEEDRLVYAAYHPCATRKVPRPPMRLSPLCARALSLSACLMGR